VNGVKKLSWVVIALALAMHIGHGIASWKNNPLTGNPIADALYYDHWSEAIASGSTGGEEPFYLPPLYPHFMALVRLITGNALPSMIFVQIALGLVSLWLIHRLTAQHFGGKAAMLAVLMALFYAPLLFYETRLMATTLAITLGLLAVFLLERGAAPAGACIGVLCLARPNFLIFGGLAALPLLLAARRQPRRLGFFLLGIAIPLGASLAYNLVTANAMLLVSANGGINFYFGNHAGASGVNDAPTRDFHSIFEQKAAARRLAEAEAGKPMSDREVNDYWMAKGWKEIGEDPGRWIRLLVKKLRLFLSSFEYGVIYIPGVERSLSPFQRIQLLPAGLLLALGAGGLWLAFRRRVKGLYPLSAFLASSLATVLIFFMADRFRLPFMAGLLPFAGFFLARGVDHLSGKRFAPLVLGAVMCALMTTASFLLVDDEIKTSQQLRARISLAGAFEKEGRLEEARAEVLKTLSVRKTATACYQLGRIEEAGGEIDGAVIRFEEASRLDPTYLEPLGALAAIYEKQESWSKALEMRVKVIDIVPHRYEGYFNVGLTCLDAKRHDEGARYLEKASELAPREPMVWAKLGEAYAGAGERDKALDAYKQAVKLNPEWKDRLAVEMAKLENE
jgi:tetratricopeptide (TPR) repeat protein